MDTQPSHAWQVMYPPLQSHAHGWLDVGDGHQIYWEECGNPAAPAALFVHGGPGAGCTPNDRRWFDPSRWRILLLDQRGAGRSRPLGHLVANRTQDLVRDIESLRQHRGVDRWLLFGGSWGATLALAYAQQHPQRVLALVLRGVFTASAAERGWLYTATGAAALEPAAWQRLWATRLPWLSALPQLDLLSAIAVRLNSGQPVVEQAAARAWLQREQDLMAHEARPAPAAEGPCRPLDAAELAMARIGVHYAGHAYFLAEGQLLAQAQALQGVPGVIVQGDLDRVTPPAAALALHRAWPGSRLQRAPDAGHASSHPAMARLLIQATDEFGAMARLDTSHRAKALATPSQH